MSKAAELAALIGSQTALSNRNVIINGAMAVSQRGTSSTGVTGSGYRSAPDRYRPSIGSAGTWTISQSTDVPSGEGFAHSYKFDCTTANSSLSAGSDMALQYRIEGQDAQLLAKGTSSAASLTVSFYVKSTKTGTFILELMDNDNAREISKAYTISSSNTWERKVITFEGDTTGALDDDNARSLTLQWWLVAGTDFTSGTLNTSWSDPATANRVVGQVNIADSTSNDWLLTGVQMELGEQATPFEHRSFGDELRRCQRYYQKYVNNKSGRDYLGTLQAYNASTTFGMLLPLFTPMRTAPTFGQSGTFNLHTNNSGASGSTTIALDSGASHAWAANGWGGISGLTAGDAVVSSATDNAELTADAEL